MSEIVSKSQANRIKELPIVVRIIMARVVPTPTTGPSEKALKSERALKWKVQLCGME